MTEGIIIAIITGACAVIGTLIGQWAMLKKSRTEDAAERARLDERTDQRLKNIEAEIAGLTAQVREHNNLKQDIAALRADVKNLQGRS